MALTITASTNPIKVTGTTNTSTKILDGPVFLKSIYWEQPTTTGHKMALQDKAGGDVIEMYCLTQNKDMEKDLDIHVHGLYCDDLDSGTLFIYLN